MEPSTAFDPKPFIRTFESAVDVLIDLRKDVQKKTEREEQSCKTAEKEYSKKLSELNKGFEVWRLRLLEVFQPSLRSVCRQVL